MSWDLVTGGGLLDNAEVTITKPYFGYDAGYMSGEQLLFMIEGTSPQSEEEGGFVRQFWSVGSGWETEDNGESAVHSEASDFRASTNYGLFISHALDCDGTATVVKKRGTPDQANVWKGLKFLMKRIPIDRGNLGTKDVLLPVEFLGEESGSKGTSASAKAKAAKAKAAAAKAKAAKDGDGDLESKIAALVDKHSDHDAFLEAVLSEYPEVEDEADLYERVLDEDGIFAGN